MIGGGPTGLAMAKCLGELAIPYDLVDRHGEAGGSFARMYGRVRLASPRRFLSLPGMPIASSVDYLTADEYRRYLSAYATRFNLPIAPVRVQRISLASNGLDVTLGEDESMRTHCYVAVVVGTGMNDHPFIPPPFNTDECQRSFGGVIVHSEQWRGADEVKGKRVLIVGSGMRGIELAEECAGVASLTIISTRGGVISVRSPGTLGLDVRRLSYSLLRLIPLVAIQRQCRLGFKYRGIDNGIKSLVRRGVVQVRPGIRSLRDGTVEFVDSSRQMVDVVVFATGYRYDMEFLPPQIPRTPLGYPSVKRGACVGIPGLYVLGVPCAVAADSDFVHGIAIDAELIANTIRSQFFDRGSAIPAYAVSGG